MAIRLFTKQKKPWFIHIQNIEGCAVVEILDPPSGRKDYRALYIDLLNYIFQGYEIVALSQAIDERQWGEEIRDRQTYADAIGQRFSVRATITADYDKPELPKPSDYFFVMHVAGRSSRPLLLELLEFGMTDLPNIMYGLRSLPDPWPRQTITWNRVLVRWFRLEETDTALTKLIEQVGLLLWTADRHLWVGLSQARKAERILAYAQDLAQIENLRLVVEYDQVD
jgi:hypothetical protein